MQIPDGTADVSAGLAYLAGTQEGIVALDLARGEIVAQSNISATPLAANGDLLLAWASTNGRPVTIRVIAAQRRAKEITPIWETMLELPDWVDLESAEPDAFSLEAEIQADVVIITWSATAGYGGGAPPPSDVEEAAIHAEHRIARLDRKTGALLDQQVKSGVPQDAAVPPLEAVADRQVQAYRVGQSWETKPWRAGTTASVLVKPERGQGLAVVRRLAEGTQETRLSDDPNAEAVVLPDGGLILVHEPGGDARSWRVFSAATAEQVASVPFDPGTEWVAVVGDRVLYYVIEDFGTTRRRSLHCRSLETGERVWSRALGEVALSAPPPPMP